MNPAFDDVALCRQLIARADDLRRRHPGRALELARAGRTLAAGIERTRIGPGVWHALQADAWSVLGSAARAGGELAEAEAALNVAICFVNDEAYPEAHRWSDRCKLAQRAAYLRSSQRRFDEALDLIDDAIAAYDGQPAQAQAACCRVDRAAILAAAGRYREALDLLVRTLETGAHQLKPRARLAAVHNVALYLYELADGPETSAEALRWLRLAVRCHQQHGESLDQLKLQALLGLTAARLGAVEPGMAALRTASVGFARHGAVEQQAGALLDIARLAVVHRRPGSLTEVAGALFPVLHELRHDRQARQGVLEVVRAIQAGSLDIAALERAAHALGARDDRTPLREP